MAESMYDMNLRLDKLIVEKRVSGMVELRGGAMHAPRPPTSTNKVTRQRDLRLDLNELSDACESLDEPAGPRRGMVCELVDDAAIQRSDGADESTDDAAVPLHGGRGGAPEDAAIPLGRDTCEPHEEGMASLCTGRRSESPEAATVPVGVGEGESYTPGAIQEMHIHVLNMDSDPRGAQPTMEIKSLPAMTTRGCHRPMTLWRTPQLLTRHPARTIASR